MPGRDRLICLEKNNMCSYDKNVCRVVLKNCLRSIVSLLSQKREREVTSITVRYR